MNAIEQLGRDLAAAREAAEKRRRITRGVFADGDMTTEEFGAVLSDIDRELRETEKWHQDAFMRPARVG